VERTSEDSWRRPPSRFGPSPRGRLVRHGVRVGREYHLHRLNAPASRLAGPVNPARQTSRLPAGASVGVDASGVTIVIAATGGECLSGRCCRLPRTPMLAPAAPSVCLDAALSGNVPNGCRPRHHARQTVQQFDALPRV
jgi:hypothetical protein